MESLPTDRIPTHAWLDDRVVSQDALVVPADEPGFALGDGIFETMLVERGRVRALDAHLARLEEARRALALPAPPTAPALAIAAVLAANAPLAPELALRLTLTARPTLLVRLRLLGERDHLRRVGLELHTLAARRGESFLARHKSLAWSANAVQRRLHPSGARLAFEGLWLDPDGAVLEGTSTNLFALIDGVVHTAPLSAPILPGVARAQIVGALGRLAIPYREGRFSRDDLERADELFASNAILPVAPIISLDGRILARASKPLCERLLTALR